MTTAAVTAQTEEAPAIQWGGFPVTGYVRESSIVKPNGVLPVNRSTLWRWVRDGHFPKPYRLGPNTVAWKAEEVRAFMDSAEQAGPAEPAPTKKAA